LTSASATKAALAAADARAALRAVTPQYQPSHDAANLNAGRVPYGLTGAQNRPVGAAVGSNTTVRASTSAGASSSTSIAARRVFDESIAEDAAFVSSSPQVRSTPFQPVSIAPRAVQQPPTGQQRLPRDVMPVAGRLNELRQATTTTGGMMRTSLFPTEGEGVNTASAARSMGAPPAAVEGRLLEMGAERIAADRDRARQFIISQLNDADLQRMHVLPSRDAH
jgi:hypothetical protein